MRDILLILLFAFCVYAGLEYYTGGFARLRYLFTIDGEVPAFIEGPANFGRGVAERFQFGGR